MTPQPTMLFSPALISSTVQAQLPEGYLMRPLEFTDYAKGYYDCLAGLTVVGEVSEQAFQETFEKMRRCDGVYHVVVIEDLVRARIVATGTLVVEQKFLRGCAKAGHIEDIVVHDSQRGKKFGIRLIDQLKHIGTEVGCYKLLLTCSEGNEPFYEKSGFQRKDLHMAQYLNKPSVSSSSEQQQQQQQKPQSVQLESLPVQQEQPQHSSQQQQQQQQQHDFLATSTTSTTCAAQVVPVTTDLESAAVTSQILEVSNASATVTYADSTSNNNNNNNNNNNSSTAPSSQSRNGHGMPLAALRASMESIYVN
ncbi:Glucosamine-phosphate N-acetyltransferase-like protein [Mortierella alpina]|uniref:Glucosamine 6-phosphate N-acetyltransferase n=1 Tax=Mortierella alpina TaxID=64518 RepID=A0A9P6LWP1_MORAP|nr:Glucosamine-phosphate N-acetyltransferase-like protein [Mortierella alpina]